MKIAGPGIVFRGLVKISSGREARLSSDDAAKLEAAMRRNKHAEFKFTLLRPKR
jgi:hypothetical protein